MIFHRRESQQPTLLSSLTLVSDYFCSHGWKLNLLLQGAAENSLLHLEAAVRKMGRVLHQVSPTGQVDGHALHLLKVSHRNNTSY